MAFEPEFLTLESLFEYHEEQMDLYGGEPGVGDQGLIESAWGAPINAYYYAKKGLFELAASYAYHIAKNHGFNDGNKRTGLYAALSFLEINGRGVIADSMLLYEKVIAMTTDELPEEEFAAFLEANSVPL